LTLRLAEFNILLKIVAGDFLRPACRFGFVSVTIGQLQQFYAEAFRQLAPRRAAPEIDAEFYHYVGLNNTIRLRGGRVYVRVSDLLTDAPPEVHQSLAYVLVAKLLKQKVPPVQMQLYRAYTRKPQLLQGAEERRKENGRKLITSSQGGFYNLELLFHKLNRRYFDNALAKPTLTWSQRETRRIFGHHDGAHDTIVISRTLDAPDVPDWVVEFVLYHEMLHVKHPVRVVKGRRYIHTAAFRSDEKRFPQYAEAQAWLEHIAQTQRRRQKSLKSKVKKLAQKMKLI
jgi:hypothetical protein